MTKQKTYTDNSGHQFKQGNSGQWKILTEGIGWKAFEGKTYIIDVGFIDQTTGDNEEEQGEIGRYTAAENDLFKHYVGILLPDMVSKCDSAEVVAKCSCFMAQAIIDELKARGRL